ncbi:cytochrome b-c1 complex subunit 6-like isoform X1 [Carex littledalei]|uniref:Complex III subunit VI n=1 Tax=Carex littledalei TaxID=544730 RepID=A0A833QJC8_9POAL|nr:cytochrome b-c1 complex subunit 6-like isoform X1 [Carex littledalei]
MALEAEEEIMDQKKYFEDTCKPKCVRPLRSYQECVKRVKDDDSGHKHCTGQYFDFWACVDTCKTMITQKGWWRSWSHSLLRHPDVESSSPSHPNY